MPTVVTFVMSAVMPAVMTFVVSSVPAVVPGMARLTGITRLFRSIVYSEIMRAMVP